MNKINAYFAKGELADMIGFDIKNGKLISFKNDSNDPCVCYDMRGNTHESYQYGHFISTLDRPIIQLSTYQIDGSHDVFESAKYIGFIMDGIDDIFVPVSEKKNTSIYSDVVFVVGHRGNNCSPMMTYVYPMLLDTFLYYYSEWLKGNDTPLSHISEIEVNPVYINFVTKGVLENDINHNDYIQYYISEDTCDLTDEQIKCMEEIVWKKQRPDNTFINWETIIPGTNLARYNNKWYKTRNIGRAVIAVEKLDGHFNEKFMPDGYDKISLTYPEEGIEEVRMFNMQQDHLFVNIIWLKNGDYVESIDRKIRLQAVALGKVDEVIDKEIDVKTYRDKLKNI